MIIVLDSNIWLRELGLNSSLGAAVRFYIRHNNARLAIPEVIRLEVEHNFRSRMKEFAKQIADNHRQLLATFGPLKEVVLPAEEDIDKKAQEIFANLGIELIEVPFSIESARSSFLKTIEKLPPSDNSQQFKDGVLWADCCSLLEQDDVFLVTEDKAFYAGRDTTRGLVASLLHEVKQVNQKRCFKLFSNLSDLLKEIKTAAGPDVDSLLTAFMQRHKASIDGTLASNGFGLGERMNASKALFATERPNTLYFKFNAEYLCVDLTGENREDGRLCIKGDGSYNIDENVFTDLRNGGEELSFRLRDGADREVKRHILGVANIVFGHKEVVHTVRYELD